MNFRSVLKKIGIGVHVVNQITETPVLGDLLKSLPVLGTALNAVHALDIVIPHSDDAYVNDKKLRVAIAAVMDVHPGMDLGDATRLIEALVTLKRREEKKT